MDGEIHHRRRSGATWSEAAVVTQTGGQALAPALAADGRGRVHLVWQDRRAGDQICYRCWNGASWDPEERISRVSGRPFAPHVAADSLGRPHAVWLDVSGYDRELWYAHRTETGWGDEIKLAATEPAPVPWEVLVASGAGGRVHVIWEDHREGRPWAILAVRMEQGEWGAVEPVSDSPADAFFPAIALDARGTLHAAWTDSRNGDRDIYYRRWSSAGWPTAGRSSAGWSSAGWPTAGWSSAGWPTAGRPTAGWSLLERATADDGDAFQPTLAVDAQGILHMAWSDTRDGNREIYAMRREPDEPWNVDPPVIPTPLTILACSPNPFSARCSVRAQLPSAGLWTLSVLDTQGRLVDEIHQPVARPGPHEFEWQGCARDGRPLPRGVYHLRLAGHGRVAAGRVVLSRP